MDSHDGRAQIVERLLGDLDDAVLADGRLVAARMTRTFERIVRDMGSITEARTSDVLDAMLRTECLAQDVCARLRIAPWDDGNTDVMDRLSFRAFELVGRHPRRPCFTTLDLLAAALLEAPSDVRLGTHSPDPDSAGYETAHWKPARNPEFEEMFEPWIGVAQSRRREVVMSKTFVLEPVERVGTLTLPVTASPGLRDLDAQIRRVTELMRMTGYIVTNVEMIDASTASVTVTRAPGQSGDDTP